MSNFLTHTTDVHGNKYLVIKFSKDDDSELRFFLSKLRYILKDKFVTFVSNQQSRDLRDGLSHTHHLTVVNAMDFQKNSSKLGKFMSHSIDDLKMIDIGMAKDDKKGNKSFFIVCESHTLDKIRSSIGLNKIDFHITLGFDKKDVFGKSKGRNSIIDE